MASWFCNLLGVGLIGAGLWGFFTGPQDHKLLEFGVNGVLSMVHLVTGAIALAAALAGNRTAKLGCLLLGVLYAGLAGAGFANVLDVTERLNLNGPDNVLNAGIAAACLFVGATSRGD
jgi:uncharacterized protein DUF4383